MHRIKLGVVGAIKGWLDTLLDGEAAPQLLEPEVLHKGLPASEAAARRTAARSPAAAAAAAAANHVDGDGTTAELTNTPLFIGLLQLVPKMLRWIDSVTIEFEKGLFQLRLECWAFLLIHLVMIFNIDTATLFRYTIQSDAGMWLVAMVWSCVHTYVAFIAYFETVVVGMADGGGGWRGWR